jgi:hypothetical protein
MVVEHGDVDAVEDLSRLFDGGGRDAVVSVLTKNSRPQMQVCGFVVEQEHTNAR